jgi:O-antigen/teichoic acid export membrane protein
VKGAGAKGHEEGQTAGAVTRNSISNLGTQVLIILVAIFSLPTVVRSLGDERFGLLTLVWTFVGYFSLLDFGVSRAITKFLAESLAKDDREQTLRITWGSILFSGVVGIAGMALVLLAARWMAQNVLSVSPELRVEAVGAFRIASVGIPFMLVLGAVRGVQMAAQRFGLVNMGNAVLALAQWLGAVVVLWMGGSLREIVVVTVVSRILVAIAMFVRLPSIIPDLFSRILLWNRDTRKRLLPFGGWVTVSQVVAPLFLYLDRFIIGSMLTVAAVAYYTVPQEALLRLLIIPMSLTTTLFPALSHTSAVGETERVRLYLVRSLKYLTLLLIPLVFVLFLFAHDILRLWVGDVYAGQSTVVFRIFAIGLFFSSLAQIPAAALQALGRPDLPAKYHLMELPLLVGLNLLCISLFGIHGAAFVWTLRIMVDAGLLFAGVHRLPGAGRVSLREIAGHVPLIPSAALLVLLLLLRFAAIQPLGLAVSALAAIGGYAGLLWRMAFDDRDRAFLTSLWKRQGEGI